MKEGRSSTFFFFFAKQTWSLMRTQPTKLDVTIYWSQQARREANTEAREM